MTSPERRPPASTDRLPPHNPEAEQGVLGCALLSPRDVMAELRPLFTESGAEFYDLRHQTIWSTLVAMYDKDEEIDIITVQAKLANSQLLEQVGGIPYLNQLQDEVPTATNVSWYSDIVLDQYDLRRLLRFCTEYAGRVYENHSEVEVLFDNAEHSLLAIRRKSTETFANLKQTILDLTEHYESASIGLPKDSISTGFYDLDKVTHGFTPQQFIIIAAGPSVGKSCFVGNWLERIAIMDSIPCGLFSLEMHSTQVLHRMICSLAKVKSDNLRDGIASEEEQVRVAEATKHIVRAPLYICDRGGLTVRQVAAIARQWKQQHNIRFLVVDYLQLLRSGEKTRGLHEEVTLVSSALKALAKNLDIPLVAVSAINREADREERRPKLSDLRQSGTLEYDADTIMFLHRQKDQDPDSDVKTVELIVAKLKDGRRGGVFQLTFFEDQTRFETASKLQP